MLDGPNGVGKTTQLYLAEKQLKAKGKSVLMTRINGGSPIGEKLREVWVSNIPRPSETDFYIAYAMYEAFAAEVISQKDKYDMILVDRSPISTVAYQAYGSGASIQDSLELCRHILAKLEPELLICYEAPAEQLRAQLTQANGGNTDYFENKPEAFFDAVIRGYSETAREVGATIIDASASVEHVHEQTMQLIDSAIA